MSVNFVSRQGLTLTFCAGAITASLIHWTYAYLNRRSVKPILTSAKDIEPKKSISESIQPVVASAIKTKNTVHPLCLTQVEIQEVHTNINDFLDKGSQNNLYHTNKYFSRFAQIYEPLSKMETLINENCEVIGSRPANIKQILLSKKKRRVVGLGQTHTEPSHTYLHACLINHLCHLYPFSSLKVRVFTEGGEYCVATKNHKKIGLFQHLRPEIAQTVRTWDLELGDSNSSNRCFSTSTAFILDTQKIFELFSGREQWPWETIHISLLKISERWGIPFWVILPAYCDETILSLHETPQQAIAIALSSPSREKTIAILKLCILNSLAGVYSIKWNNVSNAFDYMDRLRDQQLHMHARLALYEDFDSIFEGGECHIDTLAVFLKKSRLAGPEPYAHYLCLKPKEGVTEASITKSEQRIYGCPLTKSSDDIDPKPVSVPASEDSAIEWDETLDLDQQIEHFCTLKKIDTEKNHYGLWSPRALKLIGKETERIFTQYPELRPKQVINL